MPDRTPGDHTTCPRCGVGCRLEPAGDGSRARGVAGAANPDGRLCRKGARAFEPRDDRLTTPLVRRDGEPCPVSWTSAYERVVESFEAVRDAHGPDALAFFGAPHCTNEANYLLQKLARLLGTNNVDNRARHCHRSVTRVLAERVGWPATTNGLSSLLDADVVVVAGANPAERQPVAYNSFVRPAVDRGATLVHVDPVGNRTTRLADVHVTPRPGRDGLAFDCVSAAVLERGRGVDESFVERRTRGFDRFAASLAGLDRREARRAAGVSAESVERVARRLADAERVAGLVGTGIEGAPGGVNGAAALLNLLLLTGNVGRRGTGLYVLRGLVNEQGASDAGCVPDRLPGHQPVTDPAARARVRSEWGVEPPAQPGKTTGELLASFGDGVRGALVVGENPAVSKRDPEWVNERLAALDALVVVDPAASETSQHADVALPAAAGTEKTGTVTNLERRVQRLRATERPPGDARPDRRILTELGARLTEPSAFAYDGPGAVFDELARVAPTHAGLAFDDLGPTGRRWPADEDGVLYRETFETPDGRARFGDTQPLVEPNRESGLWLVTGGRKRDADSESDPDHCVVRINPADADARGLDSGDLVAVSDGDVSVRATARLDEAVREGAVYLSATAADPLLRRGAARVSVAPRPAATAREPE